MKRWQRIPDHLREHYTILERYYNDGDLRGAQSYLYNLPIDVYDEIVDRSGRGYCFETLINKIESDTINKKPNDLFKLNSHDGDSTHLF